MAEMPEQQLGDIRLPKNAVERSAGRRVIVVLQQASLETVKTKKVGLYISRSAPSVPLTPRHDRSRMQLLMPSATSAIHAGLRVA